MKSRHFIFFASAWIPAIAGVAIGGDTPPPTQAAVERRHGPCCTAMPASFQEFSRSSLYALGMAFTDDTGRPFALGSLRGRPVAIAMFFSSCGYACPLTVADLENVRARLPAGVRDQVRIVLVSFDTARDTPDVLARFRIDRALGSQWILLHAGADEVGELAAVLGVKYRQEPDGSYSHSNVITGLNAEGEIVHQRLGLSAGLPELSAALTNSAVGREEHKRN